MRREHRPLTDTDLRRITSQRPVVKRVKEVTSDNTLRTGSPSEEPKVAGRTEADSLHQKDQNLSLPKVKGSHREEPLDGHSKEVGRSSNGSEGRRP